MSAGDYAKTLLATVATLAVLLVLIRSLGEHVSTSLTRQIELKQEILRRLGRRM